MSCRNAATRRVYERELAAAPLVAPSAPHRAEALVAPAHERVRAPGVLLCRCGGERHTDHPISPRATRRGGGCAGGIVDLPSVAAVKYGSTDVQLFSETVLLFKPNCQPHRQ
jgi:hypothetical protein